MALLLAGCKNGSSGAAAPAHREDPVRAYLRLAAALGEHDPDSLDYYYGPPELAAAVHRNTPSLGEIRRDALALRATVSSPAFDADAGRRAFLEAQLEAIACRAALLAGERPGFAAEASCSFGIAFPGTASAGIAPPPAPDAATIASIHRQIAALLGGPGPLADRYTAFERGLVIPPRRLKAVIEKAIAGCRRQTASRIPLPAGERIAVEYVGDRPWAGFSRYRGGHFSEVSINADVPMTVNQALDLACHETYPGHHTYNMIEEDELVVGRGRKEFSAQPSYSPQSLLSESAAAIAAEVAFSPAEKLRFEREELYPLAGLPATEAARALQVEALIERLQPAIPAIAARYVDGGLEFARAGEELERQVLMKNTYESLKYINEFRSYVVTYTWGPQLLSSRLPPWSTPGAAQARWKVYAGWMQAGTLDGAGARPQ
jgi:hypothetical protein